MPEQLLVIWIVAVSLLELVLVLAVLVLGRQVGLIYSRMPPYGARMANPGPEIGSQIGREEIRTLEGDLVAVGPGSQRTLVVFMSPSCSQCTGLLPALRSLHAHESGRVRLLLLVASPSREDAVQLSRRREVHGVPIAFSAEIGLKWKIQTTPYAVLLSAEGFVRSKGVVNNGDHLESLLQADELGVSSLEEQRAIVHEREHGPLISGSAVRR